jgi:ribosomal protein S18 acetylase RimI-like enzyme
MAVILRPGTLADAESCGVVAFEAFKAISSQHNFPWDFPSPEIAVGLMKTLLSHRGFYSVVAEQDGATVGSNFVDERGVIAGIGPISVAPRVQDQSIGRRLMLAILEREAGRRAAGSGCCNQPITTDRCVCIVSSASTAASHARRWKDPDWASACQAMMSARRLQRILWRAMHFAGRSTVTTARTNCEMRSAGAPRASSSISAG